MDAESVCRLYAVIEAGAGAAECFAAAASVTDIASMLVVPVGGAALDDAVAKLLVTSAQRAGTAALVAGDAALARTLGADGVHLANGKESVALLKAGRELLGSGAIVGTDAGISRHDAMILAEGGADYVAFGAPAHLKDRANGRARRNDLVAWWAEIFQVPCVAFDVESAEEAEGLALAGADFVAVHLAAGQSPAEVRALIADIAAAIRVGEAAEGGVGAT